MGYNNLILKDGEELQLIDFSSAIAGVGDGIDEFSVIYSKIMDDTSGLSLLGILGLAAAGIGVTGVAVANSSGNGSSLPPPPPPPPPPPMPSGIASLVSITTDTGTVGDFITSDNTLIISGTVAGLASGEDVQIRILDSSGAVIVGWSNAAVSGNSWFFDNQSMALLEDTYTIEVQAIDTAGNIGATTSQNLEIDLTPPSLATVSITSISDDTGMNTSDFILPMTQHS